IGDVIGDINSRRGRIEGMEVRGATQAIKSTVPLSEMFGYAADLCSRTHRRASYSMRFDRYEPLRGGLDTDEEDRSAPVTAPLTPRPKGNNRGMVLPEPDD